MQRLWTQTGQRGTTPKGIQATSKLTGRVCFVDLDYVMAAKYKKAHST